MDGRLRSRMRVAGTEPGVQADSSAARPLACVVQRQRCQRRSHFRRPNVSAVASSRMGRRRERGSDAQAPRHRGRRSGPAPFTSLDRRGGNAAQRCMTTSVEGPDFARQVHGRHRCALGLAGRGRRRAAARALRPRRPVESAGISGLSRMSARESETVTGTAEYAYPGTVRRRWAATWGRA